MYTVKKQKFKKEKTFLKGGAPLQRTPQISRLLV